MKNLQLLLRFILPSAFLFFIITCSSGDGKRLPTEDTAQLEFNNMVHTPIAITVSGETYNIPAGETLTLDYESNPGVVSYYATTSGRTSNNTLIGLEIFWDYEVDMTDEDYDFVDLIIGESFFFLQYQNNGGTDLSPLYVNWGHSDETMDNILLPSDDVIYNTGYYWAHPGNEIRAYLNDQSQTYWFSIEGNHYTYPPGNNKLVLIRVSLTKQGISEFRPNNKNPETLEIAYPSETQNKEVLKPALGMVKK